MEDLKTNLAQNGGHDVERHSLSPSKVPKSDGFVKVKNKSQKRPSVQYEGGGELGRGTQDGPTIGRSDSFMKVDALNKSKSALSYDPSDPDDFSTSQALGMIVRQSTFPILGSLFHPTYMLVNAVILGKIEIDPIKCAAAGNDPYHQDCIDGKTFQSAFGIGSSSMSILLLASGLCFTLGLSQVIPQAYGAGNYKLCGAYLNRMIICVTRIFLPFLIPMQFIQSLFDWTGSEPDSTPCNYYAACYVRIVSPGVVVYFWGQSYGSFCQNQGKPYYSMISTIGASLVHWVVAYVLAVHYDMKMIGVAIASCVQFIMRFVIVYWLAHRDEDLQRSLIPLSHEDSFKDLGHIVQVGYQSFLLKVMGWWAFDVFTQLAAFSGSTTITAAQTILRNVGLFTYMIPVGFMQAATYLVGKYLGLNRVDLAKKLATQIRVVTFMWSLASMLGMLALKEQIMWVYTDDEGVKDVMRNAWWVVSIFVFFDCMQGVVNGIVTGLGIIKQVRFITIFSYWVLGIPLSIYAMWPLDLCIQGLWFGPTVAVFVNYFFYEYSLATANWQDVVDKSEKIQKQLTANMSPTKVQDKNSQDSS